MMQSFQQTIRIAARPEEVFSVWSNVSQLQRLVHTIESAEVLDDDTTRWVLHAPFNLRIAYTAHTVEREENRRLSWRARHDAQTDGGYQGPVENSGEVVFDAVGDNGSQTDVHVRIEYDLPGKSAQQVVRALNALGYPSREIQHALEEIRDHVESLQIRPSASAA